MSTWTNHSRRYTDRAPFMARMICAYYRNREYVHDVIKVTLILVAVYVVPMRVVELGWLS